MNRSLKFLLVGIIPFCFNTVFAQDDKQKLDKMIRDDSTDIGIIAGYPASVRENIFEVSTHPETIIRLGDMQKKSREDFKQLVSSYSKDEQKEIWDLMRYDGLLGKLTEGDMKSSEMIENILKEYPVEAHDVTVKYMKYNYGLLENIEKLNNNFDQSFTDMAQALPPKTQAAINALIKEPEAISVLNKNMHMTVELGDIYKGNPNLVIQTFESLNLELARQKAKDAEDFKQELKNNPEAADEYKKSAENYASENGYTENDYRETNPVVIEHYNYYPYPYWCGYPWWYENDYWYPYPYWYHWGFYYWHGNMVWIGAPSWYFMYWHFHHYDNFYMYPHLTNVYINHYYGPRHSYSSNARVVKTWVGDNKSSLPSDFIHNETQRIDRIKEYGKFEKEYVNHVMTNPKPVKRADYIKQHATEYPNLQPVKEPVNIREISPVRKQQNIKKIEVNPNSDIRIRDKINPVREADKPAVKQRPLQTVPPKPPVKLQQKPTPIPPPIRQNRSKPPKGENRK